VCLCGGLTFAAVPAIHYTTLVSFVQMTVASTAASISGRIVMSALKNMKLTVVVLGQ
jgi:hypothetical protein